MSDTPARAMSIGDVLAHQHAVLSHAQVADLARRIEQGDQMARDQLIVANLRLVAREVRGERADRREDLFQDGVIGLIRAVDRYDWRKGWKFSTYAMWWIRRVMEIGRHAIRENSLAMGERAWSQLQTVRALDHSYDGRGEERLPIAELSIKAAITPGQARALRAVPESLVGLEVAAEVQAEDAPPDEVAVAHARADALRAALADLDPTARAVVALRAGLDGPEQTLRDVARSVGISHERVRTIEREAHARLAPALDGWRQ